jgi:hypothetical protein
MYLYECFLFCIQLWWKLLMDWWAMRIEVRIAALVILFTFVATTLVHAVTYSSVDSDDVWVYGWSGNPSGSEYLQAWMHGNSSDLWPVYPPPYDIVNDASYSYLQWDLSSTFVPGNYYHITSATITLTHKKSPTWTLSDKNVMLRKLASNWGETTWYFLNTTNPQPCALLASGERAYDYNNPFPVTFNLNTQAFEDFLNSTVSTSKISFSITSALDPGEMMGTKSYKFYSNDWLTASQQPKLEIITEAPVPGYHVRGHVTLEMLATRVALQTLTMDLREPGTLNVVESHRIIPEEDGSYDLPVWHSGNYDIAVKGLTWLRVVKNVTIVPNTTGIDFSLTNGDANGDNSIDDFDFNGIIIDFGGLPSGTHGNTDLNQDGVVDDFDFNKIIVSFGETGQP